MKGCIYSIKNSSKIFIGSTTKMIPQQKFDEHKKNYKRYKQGKCKVCPSFIVFDDEELIDFEILETLDNTSLKILKKSKEDAMIKYNSVDCETLLKKKRINSKDMCLTLVFD